jgi:hypothetical protein
MSEIPDSQVVNVEDDDDAAPAPAPEAQAAPADVPPAPPEEEDLTDPELARDQQRVSGLLAELSRKRAENKELKVKAARVDEAEQFLAANRPYVDFLQQNPGFMQPRQPEPVPQAPAKPTEDPDALEAAKLMDFWTPDGKPDADRGRRYLELQDRRAQRITQQAMAPIETQTLQERSNQNFYKALQVKDPAGNSISETSLRALWGQVLKDPGGLRITADPQAAQLLVLAALGADVMQRKPGIAPPAKEPLVTEPSGGRNTPIVRMTATEEKVTKNLGIPAAKWADLTKNYTPGRPTVMEED